jgi:glycosyltransferase involved in cell wall biosynthesis
MLARGFGGAERYFVDTCRYLAGAGHQVLAVCDPRARARPLLENIHGLQPAFVSTLGSWDPLAAARLRRLLAGWEPDVVQPHLARGAHLAGGAAHAIGKRVLITTHNYVDLKYYRHVDCFLPATTDQARYLRAHGVSVDQIHVVPHFSTLEPVTTPSVSGAGRCLGALGRMVPKKGFDILLQALAEARRTLPDLRLLLGGDGPVRADLERQARFLGLEDAVEFAGWQGDAAAFLERLDGFVLPSLEEPFGIVVLEAMARGVPLVSTTTPGPREILDETCAWLVAPGDAPALAAALVAAMSDPEQRRRRAAAALERFRERYTPAAVMPRIVSLLQRLAEK